jgi:cytochrome c oxidase subunit 6b
MRLPPEIRVALIDLTAVGFDARFPNQNQTKHCWQNYVDYHKCILAKGEDFAPCRQV